MNRLHFTVPEWQAFIQRLMNRSCCASYAISASLHTFSFRVHSARVFTRTLNRIRKGNKRAQSGRLSCLHEASSVRLSRITRLHVNIAIEWMQSTCLLHMLVFGNNRHQLCFIQWLQVSLDLSETCFCACLDFLQNKSLKCRIWITDG